MDDRPLRIDLPLPPPLDMPLAEAESPPGLPAEVDDAEEEPLRGPARLFVGPPRSVSPAGVRAAGLVDTTDIGVHDAEAHPPEDWESRLRWTGLDRSARTVAEDGEGRRDRERRERARAAATERGNWDAMASPPARPVSPPQPAWPVAEPSPPPRAFTPPPDEPTPAPPRVVAAAPSVPEPSPTERRLTRGAAARLAEREALAVPPREAVSEAVEDDFFATPSGPTPATEAPRRAPARRLTPGASPPSPAPGRFVPRNQRSASRRAVVPAWVWAVAGAACLAAGAAGLYLQIRDQVQPTPGLDGPPHLEAPPALPEVPGAVVAAPAQAAPGEVLPAEVPGAVVATPEVIAVADPPVPIPPPELPPVEPVVVPPVDVPTPPVPPVKASTADPVLRGRLRIVSPVAARVKIDGRAAAGVVESQDYDLETGIHKVTVTAVGGRSRSYEVRVDEGRATLLKVELK